MKWVVVGGKKSLGEFIKGFTKSNRRIEEFLGIFLSKFFDWVGPFKEVR